MDIVDVWMVSSHPDVAENNYTDVPNFHRALRLPDPSGSRALIGSRCQLLLPG